jgi:gag-polypeptide of LTR copia-type
VANFEPVTKANLIKMKKEFVSCKLESRNQDPDQWIQGLELKKRKLEILGQKMSEMDLIIHILHNRPEEYKVTLELLKNNLEMMWALTVKEKLRIKFIRLNKDKPKK